ncbi:MAG TPA: DUF983 domain-containing protein [Acidimicrobiales bacterium]|nr:DUF983 domain-containing protein [Acidimicrobiales bacterium]
MAPDLHADDARAGPPPVGTLLRRGARRRCPRCGSGGLFRTYWSIHDRCPRCGLLFAREPGYFTGVYLLNLSCILGVLFVVVMGYALWRANGHEGGVAGFVAVSVALAVVVPIAFYPVARTLWSALDLAMAPLELDEILDAAEAVDGDEAPDRDGDAIPGDDRDGPPAP